MKGFLLFVLAVLLSIFGVLLIVGAVFGSIRAGMSTLMFGGHTNSATFWILGIIGFFMLLGGIYMRRHK